MIALSPSRITPQTTTVVSFGKDKVTYNAVPINQPITIGKRKSVYAQQQKTLDAFANIDTPMTAQNFKNVDKVVNKKGKDKEVVESPEQSLASTSNVPLLTRLSNSEELIWCTDEEMDTDAMPKEAAEAVPMVQDDPYYNFGESDSDEEGVAPRTVEGYLGGWGDRLDDEIAEAAGFDSGFINEGRVPSTVTSNINSRTKQSAFLAGNITEEDLHKLSRSLNKFTVHASSCEKCKGHSPDKCQWIMDSGASKHFTPMLSDFADFLPYNGPILQTAAAKAPLQVKGEGTIFLSHIVTDKSGKTKAVITRFYPVYHVPGMSVRLMSFGELLQNGCEVQGDALALRFYKDNRRFPLLSVEPHLPRQTIYWLKCTITDKNAFMSSNTIDSGDYDLWHKRLGHPSKRVLYEAQ
jgi:hypothetical protein